MKGPVAGDKAPAFRLQTPDGKTVALEDFRGKKVVLYFYPKDNTPGCTREACAFQENLSALRRQKAVVIGISPDSTSSHTRFAQRYGLSFPLLSDPDGSVLRLYGVWKEKSMYGKKYMGVERTTFIIDERGTVRHVFPNVKVDGHVAEVLKTLKGE